MMRAPQVAVVLLSAIIFTTLDCWDWWLGRFYSLLDALLQADHKQGPQAISYPVGDSARAGFGRKEGAQDRKDQTTVCICKRLGESGRVRRLRAIRDGKWHKCSCWGWELGEGHRPHQNGLGAQVSDGSGSRKPQLPAAVDPLAGAPDSENPSVQKAKNSRPVKASKEASALGQAGTYPSNHSPVADEKPAGISSTEANAPFAAPASQQVLVKPSESGPRSVRHCVENLHKNSNGSGPFHDVSNGPGEVSEVPDDVSIAPGDVRSAHPPTGKKHKRGRKKRTYVGRWTDCQCPHCTEIWTQHHRQLFVRVVGRGVNKPSSANGHSAGDATKGSREAANGHKHEKVNNLHEEGMNGHVAESVHGVFGDGVNGHFQGHMNGHFKGSVRGSVNEHSVGGQNGHLGWTEDGHSGGKVDGLCGESVNGDTGRGHFGDGPNGHLRGSANRHLRGSANGYLGASANGPSRRSVNKLQGTKPDLIFIHGYCASSNFWTDTVFPHLPPALLESRRVFAPDLLGTGKSPRPHDCHYTLKDHVEALEAVLAAHDVRTFHVIGHSMGSLMAVVLAARNVSRVLSVTLFSPVYADMDQGDPPCEALLDIWAPGNADRWGRVPRVLWQRTLSSIPRWYLNFARFNTHVLYGQHTLLEKIIPRLLPTLPASFVSDFLRDTWDVQLHMFNNTLVAGGHALDSAYQVLADAKVRILVDHGTEDNTCPFEGSEALARKYANVELRRCEKADHLHVVAGREREVVVEIVEEIARAERKWRLARK